MFLYGVNQDSRENLRCLFDAAHEHTTSFRSVSSIQVERHGQRVCQSLSSKTSPLDQRLSSPTALRNSGPTASSLAGTIGPSSAQFWRLADLSSMKYHTISLASFIQYCSCPSGGVDVVASVWDVLLVFWLSVPSCLGLYHYCVRWSLL